MKKIKRLLLGLIIGLVGLVTWLNLGEAPKVDRITWGVGFSEYQAERLGLDWKETYLAILTELPFSNIRLNSYWSRIEPERDKYDFSELDYQVEQAARRGKKIVIVVGRRQPRWPECHIPEWAKKFSSEKQDEMVLAHTQRVIERYLDNKAVIAWQVENEFYLQVFGDCPDYAKDFLDREIELVKSLDKRPVMLTDSGELSIWFSTARRADIFGATMYRRVFNIVFRYATYPWRPVYYYKLGRLVKAFTGFDRMVISELQMEPWSRGGLASDDLEEINYKTMSPEDFQKNLDYARASGIDEIYVWGPEWWYYMKQVRGVPDFWEQGKKINGLTTNGDSV